MEQYDEEEIGALDHEELEGTLNPNSERLVALANEFFESRKKQGWVMLSELSPKHSFWLFDFCKSIKQFF